MNLLKTAHYHTLTALRRLRINHYVISGYIIFITTSLVFIGSTSIVGLILPALAIMMEAYTIRNLNKEIELVKLMIDTAELLDEIKKRTSVLFPQKEKDAEETT